MFELNRAHEWWELILSLEPDLSLLPAWVPLASQGRLTSCLLLSPPRGKGAVVRRGPPPRHPDLAVADLNARLPGRGGRHTYKSPGSSSAVFYDAKPHVGIKGNTIDNYKILNIA